VILAAVVGSAMALSEIESAFLGYITQYGKSYTNVAEYESRLRTFAMKHSFIQAENKVNDYKLGHNKFSDWTQEEYESILTYVPSETHEATQVVEEIVGASPVDFRNGSCLNAVQD